MNIALTPALGPAPAWFGRSLVARKVRKVVDVDLTAVPRQDGLPCAKAPAWKILGRPNSGPMQGLAQQAIALRPELVNGDATVGELAWVWAKDFDALGRFWRHRLWREDGRLVAWGWVYLPYRVKRSDGRFREATAANLTWQAHPDRPELLAEILDWYDDAAGGADRLRRTSPRPPRRRPRRHARLRVRRGTRPMTAPGCRSTDGS